MYYVFDNLDVKALHQTLQILWVMEYSGGKFTMVHNDYKFYQNL
jgi:hypothetical protein